MNTTQSQSEQSQSETTYEADTAADANRRIGSGLPDLRELRRPVGDRMIAGVAAGIARYLGVDVNLVRIAFVVLAFVGGAALPLYVAGWLLIPEDGADQSIAGALFSSLENRAR